MLADIWDIISGNQKLNVLLDGTLLCHTTDLNTFFETSTVEICQVRALKERKYQLSVAIFDVWDIDVLVA